jgi:high-affinity iron transporter
MFLDAVIQILQELFEAALLVSVLLALHQQLATAGRPGAAVPAAWFWVAIAAGSVGSMLYALAMPAVSEWFDYVGQEVTNAVMQLLVIASLFTYCLLLRWPRGFSAGYTLAGGVLLTVIIAFGITREGSEIILYVKGIGDSPTSVTPVLLGGGVAAGIGLSAGILLYFGLLQLPPVWGLRTTLVLLAMFAGNMASQAMLLLNQADWLPATPQVWDSSGLLPEFSIAGQLLYGLVGYEANPSALQVLAYLTAALLIATTPLFRSSWQSAARREGGVTP